MIVVPPLTFRTYQILPHTNSYFHCLYSSLDLLPPGSPEVRRPPVYSKDHNDRSPPPNLPYVPDPTPY